MSPTISDLMSMSHLRIILIVRLSYSSSARLVLLMLMISIPKISLGEQYVRLKAMVSEIMLILRLKILNFYMNRVKLVLHMTVQDLLI